MCYAVIWIEKNWVHFNIALVWYILIGLEMLNLKFMFYLLYKIRCMIINYDEYKWRFFTSRSMCGVPIFLQFVCSQVKLTTGSLCNPK